MHATMQLIREVAEEAARQIGDVDVAGVIPTEGGMYVEILLNRKDCVVEPCRISFGILRDMSPQDMRQTIVDQLGRHLAER